MSQHASTEDGGVEQTTPTPAREDTPVATADDDPARTPRLEDHPEPHIKSQESSQPAGDADYFGNITTNRKSSSGFLASLTSSNTSSPLQSTYASSASLQSSSEHASGEVNVPSAAEPAFNTGHMVSGVPVPLYPSALGLPDPQHLLASGAAFVQPSSDGPRYPDQSHAALHNQMTTLPYAYLKARNSDYASRHPMGPSPDRSAENLSQASHSISADHTPLQSPGLLQPRKRMVDKNEPSPSSGPSLLHPSHYARVTKETNKLIKDFDSVTGNKIMNDYEVFEKLGVGSHGAVKRARNLKTNEDVAIKIVRRYGKKGRLGKHESPEDKVRKEVAVLKKARHPHVVSLYEVIDDPEAQKVYLVLEFVRLGEIIWRTQTTREFARFEMSRVNRELAGPVDEGYEADLVIQFNQKVERARVMAKIAARGDHGGPSQAHQQKAGRAQELELSRQSTLTDSSAHLAQAADSGYVNEGGWSNEVGGAESDMEGEQPLWSSSSIRCHPSPAMLALPKTEEPSGLEAGQVPDTPASLIGSQYGPYSGDERSANGSDFDLTRSFHSAGAEEKWTPEESAYRYVPCMTMSQVRQAFRDTVLGLEYLHYQGIIHRDIKPANLLWTADYQVKISDFGVSHIGKPIRDDEDEAKDAPTDLDEEYELAKTVGTPAFYAPELCDPDWFNSDSGRTRPRVTGQIDVWALGVSLYAMIYGRLPFFDENDEFAMYEKIARQEAFLSSRRLRGVDENGKLTNSNKRSPELADYEEVDGDLKDLLKRLLIKDPAKRATLREVKRHPWVIYGLEDPETWVNETDPARHSEGKKIEVSNKDVDVALVPLNLVDRIKTGLRRLGSVVSRGRDSRRRAESNAKETSGSNSSRSTTVDREGRRASLRGDEQIYSALRAYKEPPDHPLSYSVTASPAFERGDPLSARPISQVPSASVSSPIMAAHRPGAVERTESTTESIRTIKPSHFVEPKQGATASTIAEAPDQATRNDSAASSSSGLSGLIGAASRRLASTMRSRDRGAASKDNSSASSRTSSVENMASSLDDPHAFPSVALSPAIATGHVDHGLLSPDAAWVPPHVDLGLLSPDATWFPPHVNDRWVSDQQSPTAFARAERQNMRKMISEHEESVAAPAPPQLKSPGTLGQCPPSPDDISFLCADSSAEHLGSVSAVSSSEDQVALSESYSNPSIPSTHTSTSQPDTASSMLATAETIRAGCTYKTTSLTPAAAAATAADPAVETALPVGAADASVLMATSETPALDAKFQQYPSHSPSQSQPHHSHDEDEAGYNGDGDGDSSDEDDDGGIIMMGGSRR